MTEKDKVHETKIIWNAVQINNSRVLNADEKEYKWIADPIGYFLIRINKEKQEEWLKKISVLMEEFKDYAAY